MRETATPPAGRVVEFRDGGWHVDPPAGQLAAGGRLSQGVGDFELFGVELGEALAGLLIAGIADLVIGLVTGFVPTVGGIPSNIMRGIILFIAAAVIQLPAVKGPIGATAANAGSLLLAADAITAFFDLRGLISGFFAGGALGAGGSKGAMAALAGRDAMAAPGGLRQAVNPTISRVSSLGV